jgi:Tol biopolymer transport system component
MSRVNSRTRSLSAGLGLTLSTIAALASAPASQAPAEQLNRRVGQTRPTVERSVPDAGGSLERGIRTWGVGAVRLEQDTGAQTTAAPVEDDSSAQISALLGVTRKLSGSPMAGKVSAFRVSPNGATAVFIADKETVGIPELYSVPIDGSSAPTKISAGLTFAPGKAGVSAFQISPDSARVVFLADPATASGVNEIFSAPLNGSSAPVKLNTAGAVPVTGFGITPNSAWAVFFGVDTSFASGAAELYRAAIGTALSAVQISDVGQGNAAGDVLSASFSPDSAWVVYAGDGLADNIYQLYGVPIAAAGPGSDVQLSAALGSVGLLRISADSSRVVYTGDANALGRMEVFSTPIGGGTRIQLNPAMAGDGVSAIEINPAGTRVAYLADQTTAGVNEVYSAQMLVAGSGARLNTPMVSPQYADTLNIGPDGTTVLYEADQTTPGTYELYRVPIDASAGPSMLHDVAAPDDVGYFQGFGLPIVGKRAVYPVFGASVNLFSVPYDGSASFVQINPALAAGDQLFSAFLPTGAKHLMAYGAGPSSGSVARKVVAAPIRADLPVEQVNVTATGTSGVLGYEISPDEKYAVYLQDQDTSGKPELYSRELDSDADTVINAADNCPFIANQTQGAMMFPATVTALSNTTFSWGVALDVRFVRGPMKTPSPYQTDLTGTLVEATALVDASIPAVGMGWYYLFAVDCPGRSYQSSPGAEPGRDLAAFP